MARSPLAHRVLESRPDGRARQDVRGQAGGRRQQAHLRYVGTPASTAATAATPSTATPFTDTPPFTSTASSTALTPSTATITSTSTLHSRTGDP